MRIWRIYKITNSVNGKVYIGQTRKSVKCRWAGHCSPTSRCTKLKRALDKYGRDSFFVEHIVSCASQEAADEVEKSLIFEAGVDCYNVMAGGVVNTKTTCKRGHPTPDENRDCQRRCKTCMQEVYRLRWIRDREKIAARNKIRYQRQRAENLAAVREKARLGAARWRAKKRTEREAADAQPV